MEPQGVSFDPDDPRLLAGRFGDSSVAQRYDMEHDIRWYGTQIEDYQLRAWAGLAFPSDHPNAEELLEHYETLLDEWHTPLGEGELTPYDRVDGMCNALIEQGGWFPVPSTAHPDDQAFMIFTGQYSFAPIWTPEGFGVITGVFDEYFRAWKFQYSAEMTFGEYLRSVDAAGVC